MDIDTYIRMRARIRARLRKLAVEESEREAAADRMAQGRSDAANRPRELVQALRADLASGASNPLQRLRARLQRAMQQ